MQNGTLSQDTVTLPNKDCEADGDLSRTRDLASGNGAICRGLSRHLRVRDALGERILVGQATSLHRLFGRDFLQLFFRARDDGRRAAGQEG
jgi:hypothetical protein